MPVSKELYQQALDVQNACNLSGVVQSFSKAFDEIWKAAREVERGTDYVNTHPISVLFADKIGSLAKVQGLTSESMDAYSKAMHFAEEMAK